MNGKHDSMDIRQSSLYACYMQSLGWRVEQIGKWQAFIRPFPIIGSFIKIQRINSPIPFKEIDGLIKKYRAFRVVIEPGITNTDFELFGYCRSNSPYSPSKTIHIDLKKSEQKIFQSFSEAKRRAVRRAMKNGITIYQSSDIAEFIKLKIRQDFFFGLLMKNDLRILWKTFAPKNIRLFFAYRNNYSKDKQLLGLKNTTGSHFNDIYYYSKHNEMPMAGILLLFYDDVAYYWQAAATREGKKLFAPTLLVWESLKLAKKRGCLLYDFEGVYDERFPQTTKNWQGFTKFKEGFGGEEVYYPEPWLK